MTSPSRLNAKTNRSFEPLLYPARYKAAYGGRGSGKSHFFAEAALDLCLMKQGTRVVCVREVQRSLKESVKRLIEDRIAALKIGSVFGILSDRIVTPGDGVILFQGMKDHTAESIKSLEGFDVGYVEEAQTLTERSLEFLRPTIRKPGSELWFSWNPRHPSDPVDRFFRGGVQPPDSTVVRVTSEANKWCPDVLKAERAYDAIHNRARYGHIWLGDYTPATGTRLTIRSALPNTQPTSLPAGGPFPSTAVERRFDQNVRLIQQLAEEVTRTIQLAVTSTTSGVVIPEPEASKFLRWDALAENLENADVTAAGAIGVPVTLAEGGTGADLSALAAGSLVKMNTGQTAFEAAVADSDFMKAGAKGADIASASPLVLGTDGNYFNVTGTTGFSTITVAAGRLFMLRFASALSITHGASIDLPGAADITTATGDRLIGFATAANTVEVLNYTRASGAAVAPLIAMNDVTINVANNGSDANHDIDFSAGKVLDTTGSAVLQLSSVLTKQIDAAWSVGDDAGGLDTGTVAADTDYGLWIVRRSDTGVVDAVFSLETGALAGPATPPTNYDQWRLVGMVHTDASANIIAFLQVGDYFRYMGDVVTDVSDASIAANTFKDGVLSAPPYSLAHVYARFSNSTTTGQPSVLYVRTKGAVDAASQSEAIFNSNVAGAAVREGSNILQVLTDGASTIQYAASEPNGATTVVISTLAFTMLTRTNPM